MGGIGRIVVALFLLSLCGLAFAAAPWALPGWKYRAPVQVWNAGDNPVASPLLVIDELPFNILISAGKLAASGAELRMVDEQGNPVKIGTENLEAPRDLARARIVFTLDKLEAKERRVLWLYYGNPQLAEKGGTGSIGNALTAYREVKVSLGAEECAEPLPPVERPTLPEWLAEHAFVEAESSKGQGFTVQPAPGELAAQTSGGMLLVASGGPLDTVSYDFEIEAGEYICRVRRLFALPGVEQTGNFKVAAEQNGKTLTSVATTYTTQMSSSFSWSMALRFKAEKGTVRITATSEGSNTAIDCLVLTRDLQYQPDHRDFQGRVWVRWRIDGPADYRYWGKVHNELDPYRPTFQLTGAVSPFGLQADQEQLPFKTDDDYFHAGQYSPWVPLPASKAAQWHSVLFFPPKPGVALPENLAVRLEFANRPSADRIFHITPAEPLEKGSATCGVRMPTATTLEALSQLETFTEWAQRRYALVKKLNLSAPPRLTKIRVGTWDFLSTRLGGGTVPKERAKIDFEALEALGINMGMIHGVDDAAFGELAKEHGIVAATWTGWAENWRYTSEAYSGQYGYKEGETPPQRWQRVFDDYYGRAVAAAKKNSPNLMALSTRINLGDEIGQATNAREIAETPQLLAYFREWLKARGVTPADFGAADWDAVQPLDDRKALGDDEGATAKNFYWTWQFINDYTAMFYRTATETVQKYAGPHDVAVNYQAGPIQIAFLGNDNDMDRCPMNLFHLQREKAFNCALTEDWVFGWDMGIGRINLGNEMLRSATHKHNQPIATYLVGGEAIRAEFIANLSLGVKDIDLYLYGPISNVGPAWAESEKALAETADVTRLVKQFEDPIAAGVVRPRKAALLIAASSDTMQKKGLFFLAERQALYLALAHDGLPVDVVSEEEIEQDGILKHYVLLYVIDPNVREATQRKIAEWVKAGGTLYVGPGGAEWNEYNQPCTILNEALGVKSRALATQPEWLKWASAFYGWQPVKFQYQQLDMLTADHPLLGGKLSLPAWGVKLDMTPSTAKVIGTYGDGKPALLLNQYGKGRALLAGALVGEAYVRQHYPQDRKTVGREGWDFNLGAEPRRLATALAANIERPVSLSLPGIYTSVMDSPQGTLVFLNNATLAAETDLTGALKPTVTVSVPVNGRVTSIESARLGKLQYKLNHGVATFTLPLPDVDIILLRR